MFIRKKGSEVCVKTYHGARWVVETLNLKTNHKFETKDKLADLDDDKLIFYYRATRRAVASAVTGIALSAGLSAACPVYLAGVAIGTIQMGVSSTNRHRIRQEVKRRKAADPKFALLLKEKDRPIRDILIGCGTKAIFVTISCGIVGFEHIGENFAALAHHDHFMQDGITQTMAFTPAHQVVQHGVEPIKQTFDLNNSHLIDPVKKALQLAHPHLAHFDEVVHQAVSGIPDKIAEALAAHTHLNVQDITSWDGLKVMVCEGAGRGALLVQCAVVGSVNELAQPLIHVVEIGQDKARTWLGRKKKGD